MCCMGERVLKRTRKRKKHFGKTSCFAFFWMLKVWYLCFSQLHKLLWFEIVIFLLWKGNNKVTWKSNISSRFADLHPSFLTLIYPNETCASCTILAFHHSFSSVVEQFTRKSWGHRAYTNPFQTEVMKIALRWKFVSKMKMTFDVQENWFVGKKNNLETWSAKQYFNETSKIFFYKSISC